MSCQSHKQSVREKLIKSAEIYKSVFMDYDYLIYSNGFYNNPYYIINAHEDNFAHLTGVKSLIPAYDFYVACLNNSLKETDFDFINKKHCEKSVKGTVRRKLQVFTELKDFFTHNLKSEEDFTKGRVSCTIGTADDKITIGFIESINIRPMTLLKGCCLEYTKIVNISLVLRRNKNSKSFDTVIQGETGDLLDLISNCINMRWQGVKKG